MRTLTELEFLNGLKVEREILEDENEDEESHILNHNQKNRSPVKEEPFEEDLEDEEDFNRHR